MADVGTRRALLGLCAALAAAWALSTACGGPDERPEGAGVVTPTPVAAPARDAGPGATAAPPPTPNPTAVPVPAGRGVQALMAGTPQETALHLIGSGRPGPVVLVLGGVHGDEPGGWLAAERALGLSPSRGALLVIPRANRQATEAGARTLPELGDLNRLYPGDAQGTAMARMAYEIVEVVRAYQVDIVVDLHESWGFYRDRPRSGTAFLGQTISAYPNAKGPPLAQSVAAAVNLRILQPQEEMFAREFPPRSLVGGPATPVPDPPSDGASRPGMRSSLGLAHQFPDLITLLVEMGQQQPLERRVSLHVQVVEELLRQLGMLAG